MTLPEFNVILFEQKKINIFIDYLFSALLKSKSTNFNIDGAGTNSINIKMITDFVNSGKELNFIYKNNNKELSCSIMISRRGDVTEIIIFNGDYIFDFLHLKDKLDVLISENGFFNLNNELINKYMINIKNIYDEKSECFINIYDYLQLWT